VSPRRRRILRLAPTAILAVLGCIAIGSVLRSPSSDRATTVLGSQLVKAPNGTDAKSFVVSGDVDGLGPGVSRPLQLRLGNPGPGDIFVRAITVAVGDSPTGCAGSNVRVAPLGAPIFVPGRGAAQATLDVTMLGSAPGACEGATFRLTYGGSAVKA